MMMAGLATSAVFGTPTLGASSSAEYVDEISREIRAQMRGSIVLGSALERAQEELDELVSECATPNWDGYGAAPIDEESSALAYRFLESLGFGGPFPSVGADPDGEVSFEWYRGPRRTLSVSVSPVGELHFAAIVGASRLYGTEPFLGDCPPRLWEIVHQVLAGE